MSERYRDRKDIPNSVLADRLDALSDAVTKGREAVAREFTMRVPAENDRDADLVLSEAADRIRRVGLAAERENTLMAAIEYALPVLKEAAKESAGAEQVCFVLSDAVDQYRKQLEHNEGEP